MLDFIYIGIAIIYAILLILVFKKNLNQTYIRYFILLFVGFFIWHVSLYFYLFFDLGPYLLLMGRINYAATPLFDLGILGFFYYFPVENVKVNKWIKRLFIFVSIFFVLITLFTDLIDKNELMTEQGPVVTLGEWYFSIALYAFALPIITFIIGFIKNRKLNGLDKLRFQYSFWVFVPSILLFLICNGILPLFGYIDQFVISPIFLFPIIVSSFYAIARYRFLDIRLILARAASFVIFIFFCATIYGVSLFLIIHELLKVEIDLINAIIALLISIFASLSFQPILAWLRRITNNLFYKNYYERDKLLSELTQVMAQTIELEKMTKKILELLNKRLNLSRGLFLIIKDEHISEFFSIGYKKSDLKIDQLDQFFYNHIDEQKIFIYEEMPENVLKSNFRDFDISVAIPIKVKNQLVAILILGPKLSGEMYSVEDIEFLSIFASEAGLAIQNAKSFETIKQFNKTLEKKVEERTVELRQSQRRELAKARDIAKLKDEFVYIASHELRTPVTAIRGFLSLAKQEEKKLPKDVQEDLNYMSAASEHLNQLINDLLTVSRAEAGAMEIAAQPTDLAPIIKSIIQEVSPQASKEKIKVTLKAENNLDWVDADGKKIKEVIMNLLSNAIKYNRHGGKVDIVLFSIDKHVMIEVRDTGFGIPKAQQSRIFQKFFRASNEKTGEVLGTGLGLFITRMLVEKMGGKITFTSVEGKGTTFAIMLNKSEQRRKHEKRKTTTAVH